VATFEVQLARIGNRTELIGPITANGAAARWCLGAPAKSGVCSVANGSRSAQIRSTCQGYDPNAGRGEHSPSNAPARRKVASPAGQIRSVKNMQTPVSNVCLDAAANAAVRSHKGVTMLGKETSIAVGSGSSAADAVAASLQARQAERAKDGLQDEQESSVRTWVVDLASGRIVRGQPIDQDTVVDQDTEER
jgi:hypothetical protein